MKDDIPTVKTNSESGQIDITIPVKKVTDVGIDTGSHEHSILVSPTNKGDRMEEVPTHIERRKPAPPVNVQVASTPGFTGIHSIIAQWGAFGVILCLSIAMYFFITGMAKDDRIYMQNRDKDNRDDIKSLFDRMDKRDERIDRREEVLVVVLQSLQTKIDAQTASNAALISEFRTGRLGLEAKLDSLITEIKKKHDN